jgi:hypothetical protein
VSTAHPRFPSSLKSFIIQSFLLSLHYRLKACALWSAWPNISYITGLVAFLASTKSLSQEREAPGNNMSHFSLSGGVDYEVPTYVSGSGAPTAPMITPSSNHSYDHAQHDHNMDHDLTNMDPSLTDLTNSVQGTAYTQLSQAQEAASFQLQLQAAAASEAALANEMHDTNHPPNNSQPLATGIIETPKTRRLGRACDICSKRKVKCGEEFPCKNCVDLGVQCTFSRPAKRRGPTNKVVESLKRQRIDDKTDNPPSSSHFDPQSFDSIAPFEQIHGLVIAYFTYLYPIFPFPPEAVVLSRLNKREDQDIDKSFLALISSMTGLMACVFPKLIEQHHFEGYSDSSSFVLRCTETSLKARAFVRGSRNVDDAATAFFLAITARINGQPRQFSGHAADSLSILRSLGVFLKDDPQVDGFVNDAVTKEIVSRIFWAIYAAAKYV